MLRRRGRREGQVAEPRLHMPPRRRMPLRLPVWRHLALRRRMALVPGLGWPRLALLRHVSRHLLHGSRLNELALRHDLLPPKSQLRAACRSTPLLAGARRPVWMARPQNPTRLRRYPALLARWNERRSTPLHLQPRREDASAATNRPKGNPLASRSLVTVPPLVKLAQSPSPPSRQIASEIEMQIGR
jgi:hypothetical protein